MLQARQSRYLGKLACLIFRCQGVDDLVERLALENLVELVQGQIDPVIRDTALREIIGADAFRPVAGTDLVLAVFGPGVRLGFAFSVIDPGAQRF